MLSSVGRCSPPLHGSRPRKGSPPPRVNPGRPRSRALPRTGRKGPGHRWKSRHSTARPPP
ncbi:hypothetical protein UO65_2916 [Actinokineospora spheciospongiae]|uniref:Uncharacterized protein n=1 Tax=Actinokineospora spheciospongiae TaxID=909613 RepID=W7IYC1_9PSEU|nr:hypothetical protein UO65_2916 [Actinokineospora spheciospongiae]